MSAPLPIRSINHLARNTPRLKEMKSFYRDVLGFREIERPAFPFPGVWLYNYGLQIHLIVDESEAQTEGEISTRAGHLALHVDDTDAIERILEQRGIEYRRNEVPLTGVTQVFFHDPDGFHIELGNYPPTPAFVDEGGE